MIFYCLDLHKIITNHTPASIGHVASIIIKASVNDSIIGKACHGVKNLLTYAMGKH